MRLFGIVYNRRHLQYVTGDLVACLLAIEGGHAAAAFFGGPMLHVWSVVHQYTGASLFFVSSTVLGLYVADAYHSTIDFRRRIQIFRLWIAVSLGLVLQLVAYALFPHGWWGPQVAAATSVGLGLLLSVWRPLLCWASPRPVFRIRTLVVGAGRAAGVAENVLRDHPENAALYELVGFIAPPVEAGRRRRRDDASDDEEPTRPEPTRPILGGIPELRRTVTEQRVDLIVVAIRGGLSSELTRQLLECKALGVDIEEMPTLYKRLTGKVPILYASDSWLIFGPVFSGKGRLGATLQRLADIVFVLCLGVFAAPVVAIAGIAVRLESPGGAFFVQERLGKNERPFRMIKLRTMRQDAEAKTGAVWSQGAADPRVTRVGRFLRRSRIDELPQLYNVLRGDMSVIGPRPERAHFVSQLKEKIPFYGLRFAVKPGLTGWAQVKYRYGASDEDAAEKLCYELYSIQEMTPALFVFILLKTVQTVLLRPGS